MRRSVVYGLVAIGVLSVVGAGAEDSPAIRVTQLNDHLYQLTTDQGSYTTNSLASVGPDGVLLVDTQGAADAEALREVVEGFGKGAPRIIINTHRHVEHVGGNALWGEQPVIIAHQLVRQKLRSGGYLFDEYPDAALPDVGFDDQISVHFNGEEIRLIPMTGSHDDNEVIVDFSASRVVHLSSLANGFNYPSVDADGDALAFAPLVAQALEMLPRDVVIVSGHNRNGSWQDLEAYHQMLVDTTLAVRQGLAAGKDVDALKADKLLEPWQAYAGSYVSPEQWIDTLAAALGGGDADHRPTVFEPLYNALTEGGTEVAVARYRQLKQEQADAYSFRDTDLLVIGDKLLTRGRDGAAVAFLELGLEEYPDSDYAYYSHYDLAQALDRLGRHEDALRHCRIARQLRPESQVIAALLAQLEGAAPAP